MTFIERKSLRGNFYNIKLQKYKFISEKKSIQKTYFFFTNRSMNNQGNSISLGINRYQSVKQVQLSEISSIKKKTQDFRKQIRREQLDKYFRSKRKLLFQTPSKKTLLDCLQAIQANVDPLQNVCSLVNLLALNKPFQQYSNKLIEVNQKVIENFCTRMVNVLFNRTIPNFEKQPKYRIYCINAMSNLFADQFCPNVRYVQTVVQAIDQRYGGLQVWDMDKQMVEIFYMISNLMRKNLASAKLLHIQKLLAWVEEGVLKIPSDPFKCLTDGILQLFRNIDETYNSKNNYLFTQHFSANRQIILQKLVKRLINDTSRKKSETDNENCLDSENIFGLFKVFNQNKQYLLRIFCEMQSDQEDKRQREMFVNKIFMILYQPNLKKEIVKQIGNFCVYLLTFYPDPPKEIDIDDNEHYYIEQEKDHLNRMIAKIHQFLLQKNVLSNILICLSQLNIDCKRIILRVICKILQSLEVSLENPSKTNISNVIQEVMVTNYLQNILSDLVSDISSRLKDEQILKSIVHIYFLVIQTRNVKIGMKIRTGLQNLLYERVPFIEKEFYQYVDSLLQFHKDEVLNKIH